MHAYADALPHAARCTQATVTNGTFVKSTVPVAAGAPEALLARTSSQSFSCQGFPDAALRLVYSTVTSAAR